MPITKAPSFLTSDGRPHATLEDAQKAELLALAKTGCSVDEDILNLVLEALFKKPFELKEILRASGRKPRKATKASKKKAKEVVA